jgi:hypothetical protein
MLVDDETGYALALIGDLSPYRPEPSGQESANEILQANMIIGFEQAIEQGMRPTEALAAIIGWVSSEMARVSLKPEAKGMERVSN